jgi:transposase
MPNFYEYNPEQAYLLPPSVKDVLGENHLCFFVHWVVEKLDLRSLEAAYSDEGQRAYHPAMQLKVWVYAYALGITSSRRLEERIKEDLAFRYLAGGAQPDYWALNDFRRRHGRAMNDVFTQVVELAREAVAKLEERLRQIPARIERLQKSGLKKLSRVDADSRFLRERRGFTLGYTATVAVSQDYLIVAQQVGQSGNDNDLLVPMVNRVEQECRERPGEVSADSGFFSLHNLHAMEERQIDAYVPDANLARVLNRGGRLQQRACDPAHQRMRRKLRSAEGRRKYWRRKEIVEPMWGVLKEQRSMRRFRMRGLSKVAIEFTLAATALNLTRLWRVNPQLRRES